MGKPRKMRAAVNVLKKYRNTVAVIDARKRQTRQTRISMLIEEKYVGLKKIKQRQKQT